MAITNFQLSDKTKRPACCDFYCCGNKFGRIERSKYCHVHSGINRIKRSRRYVKHVERQLVQREIVEQLNDDAIYTEELHRELEEYFAEEQRLDEEREIYRDYGYYLEEMQMREKYPYYDMDF